MGRVDNIQNLKFSHIGWDEDALTIAFATTKSDKEGEKTNDGKHIYANPHEPETCVFLSLALI